MKRSLSGWGWGLILSAGRIVAGAAEPAPTEVRAALEGIWQATGNADMVLVFSPDGTGKMLPSDPEEAEGVYLPIRWTCAADGRLEISGFPDGEVLRWQVTPGDPLILKHEDGETLTLKKLSRLPEPLAALKPVNPSILAAAQTKAQMIRMAANGREIAKVVNLRSLETLDDFMPAPKGASGAEYFRALIGANDDLLPPSVLAGPGYPEATGRETVKSENIAWCAVAGAPLDESHLILLTRNVKARTLDDLKGRISDTLDDQPPFGRSGVVLVFGDGHVQCLSGPDLDQTWEKLRAAPAPDSANQVLVRP